MHVSGFSMLTHLSTHDVAAEFQDFCSGTYKGAARAAGMLRKAFGQMPDARGVEFFTPRDTSPFSQLDEDPPIFSAGATMPKASGTGGGVVTLQIYIWDRQDHREVRFRAPAAMGSSSATNRRLEDLKAAYAQIDPGAQFAAE